MSIKSIALVASTLVLSTSVNAALLGRLAVTPGGTDYQAYYDTQLDITWAADAGLSGADDWGNQIVWAENLTISGVSGWRLPNMDVDGDSTLDFCTGGSQASCMDNEYSHLYNYGAGSIHGDGITSAAPGPFSNIQSGGFLVGDYWSSTETSPSGRAIFEFDDGLQSDAAVANLFAWAVHDGDVGGASVVPVPAAVWLFGSGLIGLIGVAKRKKA